MKVNQNGAVAEAGVVTSMVGATKFVLAMAIREVAPRLARATAIAAGRPVETTSMNNDEAVEATEIQETRVSTSLGYPTT